MLAAAAERLTRDAGRAHTGVGLRRGQPAAGDRRRWTEAMQADALWRIPDPDYDRHPAYGRLFGRPRLADRLAALAELLPHLGAYAAYDVLARLRGQTPGATAGAAPSPVFEALSRDGVTALRFAPEEMAAIQAAAAPAIARLRAKLSDPAAEDQAVGAGTGGRRPQQHAQRAAPAVQSAQHRERAVHPRGRCAGAVRGAARRAQPPGRARRRRRATSAASST